MTTIYPSAEWRPCSNQSGVMSAHLGLVLHVQEGNNDLGAEFNDPGSQASYTWVAEKDGTLIQYCDADARAWAQAQGNGTYNSVGTQGFSTESLTEAQCQAIAGLYRWGHDTYGWPYQLAEQPGEPGFGWHGMGGNAWGGHFDCPGEPRKAQRQHILDLAQGVVPGAPSPPAPAAPNLLAEGSTGPAVSHLQDQLNRDGGYGLAVDGDFGPATDAAVRDFQGRHGLAVDGVVGPQTQAALDADRPAAPTPAPPSPPPPAPPQGPNLAVDGVFGPATISALQAAVGAAVDGVYGPETKMALQRHLGVAADGDIGPITVRALQARVGATQDGDWGPDTTRHLQEALNAHTF